MTKNQKKFILISTLSTIIIVSIYAFINYILTIKLFTDEPRPPKIEIPITYNIEWWGTQNELKIDGLDIKIVESKLNLFNSKSLISYTISGTLKHKKNWEYNINRVHISERINLDTNLHCERIIELTPIAGGIHKDKPNKRSNHFNFTNEHLIHSNHWGNNRIKFVCGNEEEVIELFQYK